MCAINGFNFRDEELIRRMNQITSYRGPDGTGVFLDSEISLGHNRLSIIDLSERASQPMKSFDQKQIIVFNGEIYNFKELKKELKNYSFQTQSDTEVILAAYQQWGSDCVKKLNGIFALAIWDKEKKELLLARDHVGVKPLYYYNDAKKFIFSSEIKAILEHNISRELDFEALNHYFRLAYVPHPLTIFKNIKKFPAGCWLKLKDNKIEIKKYWDISDRENFGSQDEAREKIKQTLEDSVRHQIISDRPVGIFLSGGVDSSIVLGLVRKFAPEITKTFTTGFKDISAENEEKFNTDFKLARKTAKHYGTEHHELLIGVEDIASNLEKIVWHLDEPNANTTSPAIFLLSQMAKKDVAVVLGGDGGDELFGGYLRYIYSRWLTKIFPKNAKRINSFMALKEDLLSRVLKSNFFQPQASLKYFEDFLAKYPRDIVIQDFERVFMDVDRSTWLTDDSLMRTDRMSMAHGLEARVPILDYRLVEISQKIPTSWKIQGKNGKLVFQEAFKDYLLPHLANQPKRGWFTPMAKWIRQEPLKSMAKDLLSSLPEEYFYKQEIEKIFNDHLTGKVYNINILWSLLIFKIWLRSILQKNL